MTTSSPSLVAQPTGNDLSSTSSISGAIASTKQTVESSGTSSNSLGPGPIVGIALGSIFVILLLVAVSLFCWRRRRHTQSTPGSGTLAEGNVFVTRPLVGGVVPFPTSPHQTTRINSGKPTKWAVASDSKRTLVDSMTLPPAYS
ncbi:hypothetical protein BDZ94DRAFT_291457 [Collybia nuda]|uniref:Uncharacterized protein n=1 Tax=Collybia nuda TaxID=64659 RepID=A0A9P5XSX2_9AGAR|nr:hypothetical protein BDZ94DRAFT_291457 [Collybia nuda]